MAKILKAGILQYDVIWHDIGENLRKAELMLEKIPDSVDIIFLPEMFATGFTMSPELFSGERGDTVIGWMKNISEKFNTAVAGSHPFYSNNECFNRLFFISKETAPDAYYDKRHLFKPGDEDKHYSRGFSRNIIQYRNWRIMPMICYDLRFPVWSRNNIDYDLLFYSANWPANRNDVWETLLKARAIENQAYVIGVNRTGIDKQKIVYKGNSQALSPKGEILGKLTNEESFLFIELNLELLIEFREKFPVLNDRDYFEIK